MGQTIQFAIVGAGAFGSPYINSLPALPGVELRWICDVNEELCRSVVETHRLAKTKTTSDFRDACRDSSVDALIVVTPESAHRIIVVTALEHGKNVSSKNLSPRMKRTGWPCSMSPAARDGCS